MAEREVRVMKRKKMNGMLLRRALISKILVFVLVLDLFPVLLTKLSMALGVWAPVNMIFFLGFCFSLLIIFTLTVMLSRMAERVRKLAQAVAMNEEKLDRMGRELKKLQEEKE